MEGKDLEEESPDSKLMYLLVNILGKKGEVEQNRAILNTLHVSIKGSKIPVLGLHISEG